MEKIQKRIRGRSTPGNPVPDSGNDPSVHSDPGISAVRNSGIHAGRTLNPHSAAAESFIPGSTESQPGLPILPPVR